METCVRVCMYVAKAESETRGEYVGAEPEREKGVQALELHMFGCIHACVVWRKKYKTQKGFPCNVHLSVSEHPVFSVTVKVPADAVNY